MIYVIGFLAQVFFSARILLQWILSERAKKVISPAIFWQLSIVGSYLLFVYGWLRDDFAIILGQIISYYIYIWNLDKKHQWKKLPFIIRTLLLLTPVAAILYMLKDESAFVDQFFRNEKIPLWLLIYGSMGQIIFTLRFVYQWIYSKRKDESLLPIGFWVISLLGSLIIVSYAIYRRDPVLILGQSTGLIAYSRNIYLSRRAGNHNRLSIPIYFQELIIYNL
mgnify:CR=1 FL=1